MKQRKPEWFDQQPVRHLFTATEAERVLKIPAATVRSWARRKVLFSFGLAADDTPMYDRADLVRLDERRKSLKRTTAKQAA